MLTRRSLKHFFLFVVTKSERWYFYIIFPPERTIFLRSGRHRWRRSRQTPRPLRTTLSPPLTPTTAATGTTPKATTTATPIRGMMGKASQRQEEPLLEGVGPTQTADTLCLLLKLWWWPPILRLSWRAATVPCSELHRPHPRLLLAPLTRMRQVARTRTLWARQRWSVWALCPSWFPLRAGRVLLFNANTRWTIGNFYNSLSLSLSFSFFHW